MTREKAIITLRCLRLLADEQDAKDAILIAIKALKQPEIIRCENCHYCVDGICDMHHRMPVVPGDYCSYAVWKYEDET